MEYEKLLNEAYENVQSEKVIEGTSGCSRFEVLNVSGHHLGSRTIISNFCQVASCIRRDPKHLLKFLTKELASSGEIVGERLILSRKISSREMNEKISKYVRKFVLCSSCGKPDTELEKSEYKVFLRCLACGNKEEVNRI